MTCPFCKIDEDSVVVAGELVLAIRDKHPVSEGHTLIITKRHVADYFDLTDEEWRAMQAMLVRVKHDLDTEYQPQGYNVGVNIGRTAGQTIDHVHMHLIPRYSGDTPDPKGGIRGAIPDKQKY